MGPQGEDGHKGGPGERGRPAKLVGEDRPGNKRRVLCKSGMNCNWKPKCRFGHPEGGNNMDKITKDLSKLFKEDRETLATGIFKEMDTNNDGEISEEEFIQACLSQKKMSKKLTLKIIDLFVQ